MYSSDFEDIEIVTYSAKNENKPKSFFTSEDLRNVDSKKICSKKFLSNIPEIKNVHKPLDYFENETEVNYDKDYEMRKRKLKFTLKKTQD